MLRRRLLAWNEADQWEQVVAGGGFKSGSRKTFHDHTCLRSKLGDVMCFGSNSMGQLGRGTTVVDGKAYSNKVARNVQSSSGNFLPAVPGNVAEPDTNEMVNLGTNAKARQLSAGGLHTCALISNGDVKCWGSNEYGQLGVAKKPFIDCRFNGESGWEDDLTRCDSHGVNAFGLKTEDMGDSLKAVSLPAGRTAVQVSAGFDFTCVLMDNGDVGCFGSNQRGQLGFDGGSDTACDTDKLATVPATGDPVNSCRCVKPNCTCYGAELGDLGDSWPMVKLPGPANQISCGRGFCCATLRNASVACWGDNNYLYDDECPVSLEENTAPGGALGLSEYSLKSQVNIVDLGSVGSNITAVTTSSSSDHVCAISGDGDTLCCMCNSA
jgi:alpha-tubulin suppressor-like RCC1 family protein